MTRNVNTISEHKFFDLVLDDVLIVEHVELHHLCESVERKVGINKPPYGIVIGIIKNLEVSKCVIFVPKK